MTKKRPKKKSHRPDPPFGRVFDAINDAEDEVFSIHVESTYTDAKHEEYSKTANFTIHSPGAEVQISLISNLPKSEVLRLAAWIKEVGDALDD